ncbi:hypothetical protein HMPREF3293_00789 [Christensenella minuta]|uniref:Uncharacterized protein n=1 Tax=Christensenella minuta TaxID=626937 RepID=A0A136Q6T5_9FIRM|nr:hypothetical protein HMPREF3293_00789 [Christensenella minuta]
MIQAYTTNYSISFRDLKCKKGTKKRRVSQNEKLFFKICICGAHELLRFPFFCIRIDMLTMGYTCVQHMVT